jgi:hypothetical protein
VLIVEILIKEVKLIYRPHILTRKSAREKELTYAVQHKLLSYVDGHVSIVCLQTDKFRFVFFVNQQTNIHLDNEQTVNGLRKITWASISDLKW